MSLCAPQELIYLRRRTPDGTKYCFNFNLCKPCDKTDCQFTHSCMRCGKWECQAMACPLLASGERYSDIPYCDSKWSWNRESRHNCRYSPYASSSHQSPVETSQTAVRPSTNPTASSSSTGISHSDLLERVQSLEKQYKKLHDAFREQAVIIRRFEKTLIANNLSLGPIEQISDSDID